MFMFLDMIPSSATNAMTYVWPYYCQVLAWKGLREDVLHIYHQCLINCPWNQYQPDLQAMELMVRVSQQGFVVIVFYHFNAVSM